MKVVVHPAAQDASGYYRMVLPVEHLAKCGEEVEVLYDHKYRARMQPGLGGDRVVDVEEVVDADVVVFQRPLWRWMYELMGVLQRKGQAVVVEVDDNFSRLPLRHPIRPDVDPTQNPEKNYEWLRRSCEQADLVTVTTPALAEEYGRHGRVQVIPNYIPRWYLDIPRPDNPTPIIGWTGTTESHVGDLDTTKRAVRKVIDETGAEFLCVGTGKGVCKALGLEKASATGFVPIEQYPREYARFDLAIVPLRQSVFNDSKSWLKMIEASSLGIPCVASPTVPNKELAAHGIGFIASSPEEWREALMPLVADRSLRLSVGRDIRSAVEQDFLLEDNAWKWAAAWKTALDNAIARMDTQLVTV